MNVGSAGKKKEDELFIGSIEATATALVGEKRRMYVPPALCRALDLGEGSKVIFRAFKDKKGRPYAIMAKAELEIPPDVGKKLK